MDSLKKLADRLFEKRSDEDVVDRANNSLTPFILICGAIIVFAKEYGPVSEPMYCWTQAEFKDQWMEYVHDFCFVESTYYVPFNESIPMGGQRDKGADRLNYYQWVPFILVAMALFSQLTHYFWCFCNMVSEKDLPNILRKISATVDDPEEQSDVTDGIGSHFHVVLLANSADATTMLEYKKRPKQSCTHFIREALARNCLALAYLCTKFFYLLANIVQFKFLSVFLGVNKVPNWGWTMLNSFLTHGTSWEHNGHFPRVTLCDLKIRQPDERIHEFTVQCVLVANFLNEKIFLMLYFWFILMAFVSLISLLEWGYSLLFCSQKGFVNKLFELSLLQLYPDPEFDVELMVRGDAATDRHNENGTERAETEDGVEAAMDNDHRQQQHGQITTMALAKTEDGSEDAHSDIPSSNTSTARMEETAQRSVDLLDTLPEGERCANGKDNDGVGKVVVDHHDHQQHRHGLAEDAQCQPRRHQRSHSSSNTNSAASLDKAWDSALVEAQKKRADLHCYFRVNRTKFMDFLGLDSILTFKFVLFSLYHFGMMCASAGLRMSSLVMGKLFTVFLYHNEPQQLNDSELAKVV